jgi:hypothetical protein
MVVAAGKHEVTVETGSRRDGLADVLYEYVQLEVQLDVLDV